MRTTLLFSVASITISSITMIAQQAGVNPGASAESTPSSSMNADKAEPKNSVSGELKNKLDAKTARVGETVVLKIDQKVTTVDGTVIPKGSRLIGHVTEAQACDSAHADSQLGIAFDRAELKNGRNLAIHSTIETVNPPVVRRTSSIDDGSIRMATGGNITGDRAADRVTNNGHASTSGQAGSAAADDTNDQQGSFGENINSTGVGAVYSPAGPARDTNRLAGNTAANSTNRVRGAADSDGNSASNANRATARSTGIPGVLLRKSDSSTASGTVLASKRNVHLESGTQMELSLVAAGK